VLLIDATYSPNIFGYPLFHAIGIDNVSAQSGSNGGLMNYTIALAWVADETAETYEWFRKYFEVEFEYDIFWQWLGSMSEEAIDYNPQLIKNHIMEKATKSDDNTSAGLLRQQKMIQFVDE
jgi:hypothetical protein